MPSVVGVPEIVIVPSWLSVTLSPGGTLDQPKAGAGYPLVVTVKLNGVLICAGAVDALVKAGGWPTMIVTVWVASVPMPLWAVTVSVVVPVAVGVPWMSAVPLPPSVNVRPGGIAPVSVMVGVGDPVVVMAMAPAWLRVKKPLAPEVIVGGLEATTVMTSERVAVLPEALVAERVTG